MRKKRLKMPKATKRSFGKLSGILVVKKKPADYSTNLLQQNNQTKSINDVNLYFSNIGKKLAEDLDT